ncbi:hypothetical protein RvY_14378 [Ramazzottius varieornatus]|uniref:Uncharacterized protein n=1 Tax=Ramazzottius varieornatus TaxID=947166 RepID=A0A1D1VR45_RAMVA|nr:hypothetical protein RvY_14378 [Ramazzottius varieornatus]
MPKTRGGSAHSITWAVGRSRHRAGARSVGEQQGGGHGNGGQQRSNSVHSGGGWPPNDYHTIDLPSQVAQVSVGAPRFGGKTQFYEKNRRDGHRGANDTSLGSNQKQGPARTSNREQRSHSDMETDEWTKMEERFLISFLVNLVASAMAL